MYCKLVYFCLLKTVVYCLLVSSFLVRYADAVLKWLPDIRTLVSLWQTLQNQKKAGGNSSKRSKDEWLLPEDRLKNKGKMLY